MESYQRLKVKFERDVAGLEQQLEAMKFTYLLNKGETRSLGKLARSPRCVSALANPPPLPHPPPPRALQRNSSTISAS